MEFIPSLRKGGTMVSHKGYLYRLDKTFQVSLQCSHPSIWTLLDALLKENALQQTVVNQTIGGTQPLKKKKRYEKINNALNTLFEKREETPKLDFLRGCSYNLKLNV